MVDRERCIHRRLMLSRQIANRQKKVRDLEREIAKLDAERQMIRERLVELRTKKMRVGVYHGGAKPAAQ